jgi:hypothetical protein
MGNELMTVQQTAMTNVNALLKQWKGFDGIVVGNETYLEIPPPTGFINSAEVVNINPDMRFREVYLQKGGQLALTAVGLKKLGKAMGIRFGPGKIVERRRDKDGNTVWIIFESQACCRQLDGQFAWSTQCYEIDLGIKRKWCVNTQEKNIKYWRSGAPGAAAKAPPEYKICKSEPEVAEWVAEVVALEMLQIEANALTRAITGSQTRCIRDLGPFQPTYLPEQLAKPFLVPKIVPYFDPINPMDRAFALEQTKQPMMMYPEPAKPVLPTHETTPQIELQAPPIAIPPPSPRPELNLPSEQELIEIDEAMDAAGDDPPLPDPDMQIDPAVIRNETAMMDFDSCDDEEKLKAVDQQIKMKQWAGHLSKLLSTFTPSELKIFYMMLVKLPMPESTQTQMPWSNS